MWKKCVHVWKGCVRVWKEGGDLCVSMISRAVCAVGWSPGMVTILRVGPSTPVSWGGRLVSGRATHSCQVGWEISLR